MAVEKIINISVNEKGTKEAIANAERLADSLNKVENASAKNDVAMGAMGNSVLENGGAMGLLNDATGGMAMTVKDAVEATWLFTKSQKAAAIGQSIYTAVVGTSTGAMKVFRLALIGTGIGAIVVGIGLLIANFDKVKKVVMNLVPGLGMIADLFEGLVDAVTDFVGMTSAASRAIDKMVDASNTSLKKSQDFLDTQGDKYDEFTKRKIQANIDYNKKVVELAADETRTEEEKLKLLKDFRDKADREIVKSDADRIEKLAKARKEAQDKIDSDNKAASEKTIAAAEKQKAIDDKLAEEKKKLDEENLKAFNEFQIARDEAVFNQRILDIENLQWQADEIARIEGESELIKQQSAAEELARHEASIALAEAKWEHDKKMANAAANLLGQAAELAGKATTAGKILGVAQATISTFVSAVDAFKGMVSAIPGPVGIVAGVVAAGFAVVSGFATIKKILAVKVPGGGGGAPSAGSLPAPPSFNIVGQSGTNQLAQSIGSQQNKPVQSYVVSSNVTTAQALDRNRIAGATFN